MAKAYDPRRAAWFSWRGMITRCYNSNNPGFRYYGERGIRVCDQWRDFEGFYQDMGPRPLGLTIERLDSNGNYEPGNCKWATLSEQQRNKRPHGPQPPSDSPMTSSIPNLTDRELQITVLLGKGYTYNEIGKTLGISPKTVECHKSNIMRRCGVRSRTRLIIIGLRDGWLSLEELADFPTTDPTQNTVSL